VQWCQRRVRYLGEIHDSQPAAWRKTLEVFDEQQPGYTHIPVAFVAYCLSVPLKHRLQSSWTEAARGAGEARQHADARRLLPTTDGRCLTMPRYTEPAADVALLLHPLKLTLPSQPPPRIAALSGEPLPPLKM
jgi:hypothetical protein